MAKRESCLTEKQQGPFERCYAVYRKSRRDRGESEKAWMDLNPDEKRAEDIFQRILAWNKYWAAESTPDRYIKWFSRWLKKCTRDDIPSRSGLNNPTQDRPEGNLCSTPGCNHKVMRKFTLCKTCEADYEREARTAANAFCKSLGLETKEAMRQWARETLRAKFNRMRG